MKKLILTAAILSAATIASADILAGFSFSNLEAGASSSGNAIADISDLTGDLDAYSGGQRIGTSNATLWLDGSNGSSDFKLDSGLSTQSATYQANNLTANTTLNRSFGDTSINTSPAASLGFAVGRSSNANDKSFVIGLGELTDAYYTDITLTYAGATLNSSNVSLLWEYSYDGSTYFTLGTDNISSTVSSGGTLYTSNEIAGGSSELYLKGTIDGINSGDNLVLDNLVIYGSTSAVPEPSTYAAIAGGVALAFVALRRRRLHKQA